MNSSLLAGIKLLGITLAYPVERICSSFLSGWSRSAKSMTVPMVMMMMMMVPPALCLYAHLSVATIILMLSGEVEGSLAPTVSLSTWSERHRVSPGLSKARSPDPLLISKVLILKF